MKQTKTIGVCGYISTGSSAVVDVLQEFDDIQVLNKGDFEFRFVHSLDGLEDLEYHLKKYSTTLSSAVAIERFRNKIKTDDITNGIGKEINTILDEFLSKIVQCSLSRNNPVNRMLYSSFARDIYNLTRKYFSVSLLRKIVNKTFSPEMKSCVMLEKFDGASKYFIDSIINAIVMRYHNEKKKIIVLNQPFDTRDPVKSFKYFENPVAIIVDRDPRDQYLFSKCFLYPRGMRFIPCGNVNNYIEHFRLMRQSSLNLRKREDVVFLNFEELVYDCENTVKKIADFVGITERIQKGEYFKPAHSRNNTQLFKKHLGYESDIKKIEQELPEYIFPFEHYPDIEAEGRMFYGSQSRKKR